MGPNQCVSTLTVPRHHLGNSLKIQVQLVWGRAQALAPFGNSQAILAATSAASHPRPLKRWIRSRQIPRVAG